MLIEKGIKIYEGFSGIDGVFHNTTRIEISKTKEFLPENTVLDITLTRTTVDDDSIFSHIFSLDFEESNTKYYLRTTVGMSDGTFEEASRISAITRNGHNSCYQYANTIIKDPKVSNITANENADGVFTFTTPPLVIYSGAGEHTHTSWRIVNSEEVVWERLEDPDNLEIMTLPINLEPGGSYTMEAKHHIGDVSSNWGKCYFTTTLENQSLFHLEQYGYGRDVLNIKPNEFNFIRLQTRLNKMIDNDWAIYSKGVVVLRKSSITREVETDNTILFISGYHLEVGNQYTLKVMITLPNSTVSRSFDFTVRPEGFLSRNNMDRSSLNEAFIGEAVLMNLSHNVLYGHDSTIGKSSTGLIKYVRTGGTYQPIALDAETLDTHKVGTEVSISVVGNKLLVQTFEIVQDGLTVNTKRKLVIYDYDPISQNIFNASTSKTVYLGYAVSDTQSLEFVHSDHNQIQVITLEDNDSIVLRTLNLNTGAQEIDIPIIDITRSYGLPVPHIAFLNESFVLIVDSLATYLLNPKNDSMFTIAPVNGEQIDFSKWLNLITKANGDIYLIGIDSRVTGEENITYLRFNESILGFEIVRTVPTPGLSHARVLSRPNILITNNNYIGLSYNDNTLWLS